MAPDSSEVRLARLDEVLKGALNRLETMSEAYAPTNRQVIENALRIAELQKDLAEMLTDRSRLIERGEAWSRKIEQEVLACATASGQLEARLRQETAARDEKDAQAEIARLKKVEDDRKARQLAWALAIFGALASLLLFYLGTVVGG